MPHCYLLTTCNGSSVDQQSTNVSLFSLVENVSVPASATQRPNSLLPLEVHAYWRVGPTETKAPFQARFVMVNTTTGLETSGPVLNHRPVVARFRTRTLGVPFPPVLGEYTLHVDRRATDEDPWSREAVGWPIHLRPVDKQQMVTH